MNTDKLNWKNVFNTSLGITAGTHINDAIKLVKKTGYSYFTWNGDVYDINGNEIKGVTVDNLNFRICGE